MMYRTHCQRILDTVISANFDEVFTFVSLSHAYNASINLRMFAANICHFGTSGFSFLEHLVNGCRYCPNILYLDTY